jgi:prepilin-type N-terminal cleavage/methylation domain-containing protein
MKIRFPLVVSTRGFTLVEVLVAAGLIALLAAVLAPVLLQAKARADERRCVRRLAGLGAAMRMYLDDYDSTRPARIHQLFSAYVPDQRLFLCPRDGWTREGGWAWAAWGRSSTPPERWPFPISYGYFFSLYPQDPTWALLQRQPGHPGYLVCVLHGRAGAAPPEAGAAPGYSGRVHRLCFDGSVVVQYLPSKGFNAWLLMTGQPRMPELTR